MSITDYVLVAVSGFAAGLINALAGGGTLVSFPALVALGIPAVSANVTNTVALVPGYLGGAYAQRRDLVTYVTRLRALVAVAALGGLTGSILLVNSSEDLFSGLVPILILLACALLGFQDLIRKQLVKRRTRRTNDPTNDDSGRRTSAHDQHVRVVFGGRTSSDLRRVLRGRAGNHASRSTWHRAR